MVITYPSMNMPRDSSLSIYKVLPQLPFRNTFRCFPCCIEALIVNAVGEAESGLERLHQCAEKELQGYLDAEGPTKEFNEFRTKLAGLTRYLDSELNLELQSISTSGW